MFLHTDAQLVQWQEGWQTRIQTVAAEEGLDPTLIGGLVEERWDWMRRHPCRRVIGTWTEACEPPSVQKPVEEWRPLVQRHFGDQTPRAMCVLNAESSGNPRARNPKSGARGLFQIMPRIWAPHFGVSPDALYDPATNVRLARKILDIQGWRAWSPIKRGAC